MRVKVSPPQAQSRQVVGDCALGLGRQRKHLAAAKGMGACPKPSSFGGVETGRGLSRVLLYDNLNIVVLERVGDAIRFHPTFLDSARHYRFEPRPMAVARRNEKGRV